MSQESIQEVATHYDEICRFGLYGLVAPEFRGGPKCRYMAAVMDMALLPHFERETGPVRVLDFGCGTGIFTVQIQPLVKRVVGMDISRGVLEMARSLATERGCEIPFIRYGGLRIPFVDTAFPRIVAREALCHVPDRSIPGVLTELARVTEPGGKLYLVERVTESPELQRPSESPWSRKRGVDELIQIFREGGFDLESVVAMRQPRFPWIYPIWFRIFPGFLIRPLARLEVLWNRHLCPVRTNRWQEDLFVFRRRRDGD